MSHAPSASSLAGAALVTGLKQIEVDLSQVGAVKSGGVGVLLSLCRTANARNQNGGVALRLLNPAPPVRQMFALTVMCHVLEIVSANESVG